MRPAAHVQILEASAWGFCLLLREGGGGSGVWIRGGGGLRGVWLPEKGISLLQYPGKPKSRKAF